MWCIENLCVEVNMYTLYVCTIWFEFWSCYFKVKKKVTWSKISTWRLHNHVSRLKVREWFPILPGTRWPPKAPLADCFSEIILTPFSGLLRPRDWGTGTTNFGCPHCWQPWLHVWGKSQHPQPLMIQTCVVFQSRPRASIMSMVRKKKIRLLLLLLKFQCG